jgi:two-component system cell cycle response regulator DivK
LDQQDIAYTSVKDPTKLKSVLQTLDQVDIIFLDLEMPHLDGYEALEILKNHFGDSVPIVACTVHTAEIHTTQKLGFFSFVAKPLDFSRFPNQLKRILDGNPVWEAR